MVKENFIKLYETSFRENWSLPAFTNYSTGNTYSYADMAKWVAKVHIILERIGVEPGDKVTIVAKDSPEWCMVYMGVVTYGAIIVPILPDFNSEDIHNIIRHSDSKVVFATGTHLNMLMGEEMPEVHTVMDISMLKTDMGLSRSEVARGLDVEALFAEKYPEGFTKEDVSYRDISNEEVVLINYTSGTTGFSKGVILTANNLAGNIIFAKVNRIIRRSEKILSFLPNAHAYGCAFNFLAPVEAGAHIYMLGVLPTPAVLMQAFKDVRPNLIISVPLILEKIYKNVLVPTLKKFSMRILLKLPIIKGIIHGKIRQKLVDTMGGEFREFIVGGAAMNEEVTNFLHKIRFPYTVGYGMTECAPLISYIDNKKYVPMSCGKILPGLMEVRIADVPESHEPGIGEIQVRGEHVCKGYYKNEEATLALFTSDGWMRTGDLGTIDKHGNIFIKGRGKSMLLGPSGQNIYPEEIEAKINLMPYVAESLVLQRSTHQLVALIFPDEVALKAANITTPEAIQQVMNENKNLLNQKLAAYERVSAFQIMDKEFEKTPKKSIKRYLYKVD
ncbi:AMP-binding protein [Porphyromonas sp.]|uniref:AMP-binding protein n=1 Tax=Porphyromonas sp. TaxID=1924944 RepID=UPI0026DD3DBD|nr:AMP-binding protein [Porphyromonas sp.]MDO4695732.1 AMP-binding protein [Porphyromonas sp.]MDO4771810.1 AMP-binding protein [Porphyromonas sp.]